MIQKINYPIDDIPNDGELIEIAPSVFWLRIPMPFSLDHINLWLIEDADHWSVIDSGLLLDNAKELWLGVIEKYLKGKPIKRVICTHMHPDHIGLAGWLCQQHNAQLWMSQGEHTAYNDIYQMVKEENYDCAHEFYRSGGLKTEQLSLYKLHISMFEKMVYPLPSKFRRLNDQDEICLAGYLWQVVVGAGHSPEHVCLWCEELAIFISGDQLLPTISSNISVYPERPKADPLTDWLSSCYKLKEVLDNDVLVLPAHGRPFQGASIRLEQQIAEIEDDLVKLFEFCKQPRRMVDAFPILFNGEINENNLFMASGESQAHFNCLISRGLISSTLDDDKVFWYRKIQ